MEDSAGPSNKRPRRERSKSKYARHNPPKTAKKDSNSRKNENESPNSLLVLSDDCLQELFERLDIETLCHMANVCKRFRQIALQTFTRCHKEFVFTGVRAKSAVFRRALCKFGHLMTSIKATDFFLEDFDEKLDGNAIVKYCTNGNLDSLILQKTTINCDAFKPLFARMKCINLIECKFIGNKTDLFKNCPNLEIFSFHADFDDTDTMHFDHNQRLASVDFVIRKFPKLDCLGFGCGSGIYWRFFDLLALNPQIKEIKVLAEPDDIIIEAIAKYSKNLERLTFDMDDLPEIQTRKGLLSLSKLKKLKQLSLVSGGEVYSELVGPLMDAFAKKNVPIEELQLFQFSIRPKDIKSILKLKMMKIMTLIQIEGTVSDADLVPLTKQLKLLEHLQLNFDEDITNPISANGLVKMVTAGKHLQFLALIGVQNLKIDQKVFENILKAVQNRRNAKKLTIEIAATYNETSSFNVPESVQQAASAHLKIKYSIQEDEY